MASEPASDWIELDIFFKHLAVPERTRRGGVSSRLQGTQASLTLQRSLSLLGVCKGHVGEKRVTVQPLLSASSPTMPQGTVTPGPGDTLSWI